jgi:hypothetical protein
MTEVRLELGELTGAERELHTVDRDAEALRQPLYRLLAASRRSTLALLRGRPEEALAHAKAAREIGHRGHEPDTDAVYWGQAFVLWQEGALSAEDRDEVEAILRPLIAASPLFAGHAVGLVLLCLGTGRADEAHGHYDAIVRRGVGELPHDMTRVWTLTQLALACVAFADRGTAELLYRELVPSAGRCAVMAGFAALTAPAVGPVHTPFLAPTRRPVGSTLLRRGSTSRRDQAADLHRYGRHDRDGQNFGAGSVHGWPVGLHSDPSTGP